MAKRENGRTVPAAALLLLAIALGGCASTIADLPMVGTPAGAPARPAGPGEYLPVHDMPATRDNSLTTADQARIQAELIAARDRQAALAQPAPAAPAAAAK